MLCIYVKIVTGECSHARRENVNGQSQERVTFFFANNSFEILHEMTPSVMQ